MVVMKIMIMTLNPTIYMCICITKFLYYLLSSGDLWPCHHMVHKIHVWWWYWMKILMMMMIDIEGCKVVKNDILDVIKLITSAWFATSNCLWCILSSFHNATGYNRHGGVAGRVSSGQRQSGRYGQVLADVLGGLGRAPTMPAPVLTTRGRASHVASLLW